MPENRPSKLERSSSEAYIGIAIAIVLAVVPMNWWLMACLFVVLCLIGADISWRSPFTYRWSTLLKIPLATIVSGVIAWGGVVRVQKQFNEEEFPQNIRYLLGWGPVGDAKVSRSQSRVLEGVGACEIRVNEDAVAKFSGKYRIVGFCLHYDGLKDPSDVGGISKSEAFDISSTNVIVRIPWNDQYTNGIAQGQKGTNYGLLLVPKSLSPDRFNTIREATSKGAVLLQVASGPP